jgi:hypothetical protein
VAVEIVSTFDLSFEYTYSLSISDASAFATSSVFAGSRGARGYKDLHDNESTRRERVLRRKKQVRDNVC